MAEHTCAVEGRAACLRCMEIAEAMPKDLHKVSPEEMSAFWARNTVIVRAFCGETFTPKEETSMVTAPLCRICFAPNPDITYAR